MSWFPAYRPQHYFDVVKILCGAVNERLQNFPFRKTAHTPLLEIPDRACSAVAAKDLLTRICDRIITLLSFSLDPRQIGSWCDFRPFADCGDRRYPGKCMTELLDEMGVDADAFLLRKHPQRICDMDFAVACYRLLDEIILWQSPQNSTGAGKGLNIEADLHFTDLETMEHKSQKYSDGFLDGYGYERLAYWEKNNYKRYAENIHIENNSDVPLYGFWQMRYTAEISEKTSRDSSWRVRRGTYTVDFEDNISSNLELPYTEAEIKKALSHGENDGLDFHYISLSVVRESKALIKQENLPELNYFYKD